MTDPEELARFKELNETNRLGPGESAAAAAAWVRGHALLTDDRRAKKIIRRLIPELRVLDTADVIRRLSAVAQLTVAEANEMKAEWESTHRFKLPFETFADQGVQE